METRGQQSDMGIWLDEQLVRAVKKSDYDGIGRFLNLGARINPRRNSTTPLIEAAKRCSVQMVDTLLEYGADVNEFDEDGLMAIDYAGSALKVVALLEAGSELSFKGGRLSLQGFERVLKIYRDRGLV